MSSEQRTVNGSEARQMRTVAPAKINWTLEVLGRRDDGYHEIRSVMQTIDLCDEVVVRKEEGGRRKEGAGSVTLVAEGAQDVTKDDPTVKAAQDVTEDDLTVKAARALEEATGRDLAVAIRLVKGIPMAAGLGGGSSDGAAVLRCVNGLYRLGLSTEELATIGAGVGSDVPFFVYGGPALVEGHGERVTRLPDVAETWLVVVAPPISVVDKTRRMYEALSHEDFSDGTRGEVLSQRLRQGEAVREESVHNLFERVAYKVFEGLETYRDALLAAGAEAAHLAGAGSALFAMARGEEEAREMANRVTLPEARVFVARTLGAREATAVTD